jgi:hypothetical protein
MSRRQRQYQYESNNKRSETFNVIKEVVPGRKQEYGSNSRQTRRNNAYVSGANTLPNQRKYMEVKNPGKSEEKKCICGLDYPDSSDEEDNKRRNRQSVPRRRNEPEVVKIKEVEHIKIKNVENVKKTEDEEKIRIMEETRLQEIDEENRIKIEEEKRKLEAEKKRIEEGNRRRKEQEQKRKMDELRRKKEDDERRKQLEDEERKRLEDERQRLEDEKKRLAEEARRRNEEEKRNKYEEERRKREAEERERNKKKDLLNEQIRVLEEEEKLFEEEKRLLEEEKRRFAEKQGKLRAPREKTEVKTQIIEKEEEEEEGLTNLNKKFIYDEAIYVYKTSETKTFYSEYIQKKYQNVQAPFPTRNTKTVVIGSNEENVSANTYIINRNNVDKINVCGQLCPDCQQRETYEQNMIEVGQSACPTCGRMTA